MASTALSVRGGVVSNGVAVAWGCGVGVGAVSVVVLFATIVARKILVLLSTRIGTGEISTYVKTR